MSLKSPFVFVPRCIAAALLLMPMSLMAEENAAPPSDPKAQSMALYQDGLKIEKAQDLPAAIAKWDEALKLDPLNEKCLNHYAWFLAVTAPAEHRNLDKALELAQRATEASAWKNKDILDTLAEVHFQRKEYAQAVEVQKKALAEGLAGHSKPAYLQKQLAKFEEALQAAGQE